MCYYVVESIWQKSTEKIIKEMITFSLKEKKKQTIRSD